jgi:hypothetical protein
MNTISVNYTLVWKLSFADNYRWTKDGKCFNVLRGTELKQCYNSGSIGYNIRGKFHSLKSLRKNLIKIENINIPF